MSMSQSAPMPLTVGPGRTVDTRTPVPSISIRMCVDHALEPPLRPSRTSSCSVSVGDTTSDEIKTDVAALSVDHCRHDTVVDAAGGRRAGSPAPGGRRWRDRCRWSMTAARLRPRRRRPRSVRARSRRRPRTPRRSRHRSCRGGARSPGLRHRRICSATAVAPTSIRRAPRRPGDRARRGRVGSGVTDARRRPGRRAPGRWIRMCRVSDGRGGGTHRVTTVVGRFANPRTLIEWTRTAPSGSISYVGHPVDTSSRRHTRASSRASDAPRQKCRPTPKLSRADVSRSRSYRSAVGKDRLVTIGRARQEQHPFAGRESFRAPSRRRPG